MFNFVYPFFMYDDCTIKFTALYDSDAQVTADKTRRDRQLIQTHEQIGLLLSLFFYDDTIFMVWILMLLSSETAGS